MKVSILKENDKTEEYEIVTGHNNCQALMVSLDHEERTNLEEMPPDYMDYGTFETIGMNKGEMEEWMEEYGYDKGKNTGNSP